MIPAEDINYKIQRECSRQWRILLASMAQELADSSQQRTFHELGQCVGMRYAAQAALPPCSSLKDLEEAITARWQIMDWGWINLDDQGKNLLIVHHGARNGELPISAFGDETQAWAPSFLSGAYQQWLASLGAGEKLHVRQITAVNEFGTIEFQLGL